MSVSHPDPMRSRTPLPLWLFALANIGGVIAYWPLLTLLVPMRVEVVSPDERIALLSLIAVAGAVAASGANILFGWLSDRSRRAGGGRRVWMAMGLAGIAASYAAIGWAATPMALALSVLGFQVAVNALLAPMMAVMAEEIRDARRGMAGALLALGNPVAAALSAWLVGEQWLGERGRLVMVVAVVLLCTLPLLLVRPRMAGDEAAIVTPAARPPRRDFWMAGLARLLVQVAAVVTHGYLLYYFETIVPPSARADLPRWVGQVFTLAFIVPLPIALLLGRMADRTARRQYVLLLAALVAASGLFAMTLAKGPVVAAGSFILYTAGSSVFVALHSGLSFQLLPDPRHRGRDLGLFNLTNTLPGLIGAGLAWRFATPHDFGPVLSVLAMMTLAGGLTILGVRAWR